MATTVTFYNYEQKNKIGIKMSIKHLFGFCGSRLLNLRVLCDLVTKTHIYDFYFSLSDLYFIVKSKMDVILHIYN